MAAIDRRRRVVRASVGAAALVAAAPGRQQPKERSHRCERSSDRALWTPHLETTWVIGGTEDEGPYGRRAGTDRPVAHRRRMLVRRTPRLPCALSAGVRSRPSHLPGGGRRRAVDERTRRARGERQRSCGSSHRAGGRATSGSDPQVQGRFQCPEEARRREGGSPSRHSDDHGRRSERREVGRHRECVRGWADRRVVGEA